MCEHGDTVDLLVLVPAHLAAEGVDTWKTKPIDRCIAPVVAALNVSGLPTAASCCGHGKSLGSIVLADGREILVRPFVAGGEAWRYADPNGAVMTDPPNTETT